MHKLINSEWAGWIHSKGVDSTSKGGEMYIQKERELGNVKEIGALKVYKRVTKTMQRSKTLRNNLASWVFNF